jgi:hypothetical protein
MLQRLVCAGHRPGFVHESRGVIHKDRSDNRALKEN